MAEGSRRSTVWRAAFALLLATGPLGTACELVLEFDRTPLQPVYDGAVPEEEEDGGGGGGGRDGGGGGGSDGGGGGRDSGTDTGARDAAEAG